MMNIMQNNHNQMINAMKKDTEIMADIYEKMLVEMRKGRFDKNEKQ